MERNEKEKMEQHLFNWQQQQQQQAQLFLPKQNMTNCFKSVLNLKNGPREDDV